MRRRSFFRIVAGTAAAAALPGMARRALAGGVASAFDRLTRSYARFCATPQMQREFYALHGASITPERLRESSWRPTEWGHPPELPVPGGSWDGVPMAPPLADLAGEGPFQPTWDSLLQYQCPEWYRDAKFGIWNHWSPQCVPEDGDWYARNMYIQGAPTYGSQIEQYEYHLDALRPSLAVRLQGSLRAVDAPQLAARGADGPLRACRREAVRGAGQSSRRFRYLEFRASPVERAQHRTASRRDRHMGAGCAPARPAVRRHGAPGAQLVVVSTRARRRPDRPLRGCSLRRRSDAWPTARGSGGRATIRSGSMVPSIRSTRYPTSRTSRTSTTARAT